MWRYKVLNKLLVQNINGLVHLNVLYYLCLQIKNEKKTFL